LTSIRRILVLLACLCAVCCGCGRDVETAETAIGEKLPHGVDMRLSGGVRLVEWDGTRKVWSMESERATYSTGENLLYFSGVAIDYYEGGEAVYGASSERGTYLVDARVVELLGDVKVTSRNGYTLATDRLSYSFKDKIARNEVPLTITGEGLEMSGEGMEADLEEETLEIKRGVGLLVESASVRDQRGSRR